MRSSFAHRNTTVFSVCTAVFILVFTFLAGNAARARSIADEGKAAVISESSQKSSNLLIRELFAYTYNPVAIPLTVFTNPANIAIPDDGVAGVTSTITVSGAAGPISAITLTLNNLTTPRPQNLDFLLVGPGGQKFVFLSDAGGQNSGSATSNVTMTFSDASSVVIQQASNTPFTTGTFKPIDYDASPNFPTSPPPYQSAAPQGSATFTSVFGGLSGASVNGNWVLHVWDGGAGGGTSAIAGGWSLDIVTTAAASTTTTVSSSANPSFTNQAITLTSTTTSSSTVNTGNVNFVDNTTSVTLCSNAPVNGSGVATCVVPANTLTERIHQITATYVGNATFATSNAAISQEVNNPTQVAGTAYTNPGTITIADAGFTSVPYPSNIFVTGLSGSISKVTVTFTGANFPETGDLDFLLVGPAGQKYVLWSDAGGGSSASTGTFILDDAAPSQLPASGSITAGTYRPADHAVEGEVFPAPAPAPPFSTAGPNGSSTFASVFGGAAPNGKWSLYATDDSGSAGVTSTIGSWTLTFTTTSDAATTTVLTSSPNPATNSQAITLTATVTSSSTVGSGTVTFRRGATVLCGAVPVNGSGVATCNVPAGTLTEGSHLLTADYNGSPGQFNISSGTITQVVNSPTVVTCLNFANNGGITISNDTTLGNPYPSNINVSGLAGNITKVTLRMTVGNAPTPDHTDFLLVGPGGQKFLFMGDAGGTTDIINQTLTFDDAAANPLPDSTAIVTGTYRPTAYAGDTDIFPAPAPAGPYDPAAPEGAGTFASVFNGSSPNGTWKLYAVEDAGDAADTVITNWSLDFTLAPVATTTVVTSSVNPSVFGQPVTFTATVTSAAGTPSGNVQFFDGATPLGGAVALNGSGQAQITTSSLSVGSHTITAQYAGSSSGCTGAFNASNGSLAGAQQVEPANTAVAVASSVNPSFTAQPVTFTASVTAQAPSAASVGAAGTASFFANGNPIAGCSSVALNAGGQASCPTTFAASGNYNITAQYSGTANFNGSNNNASPLVQQVLGPPVVTKSFSPSTVVVGGTSVMTLSIQSPNAGVNLPGVNLTDNFPAGMVAGTPPVISSTNCGGLTITDTGGTGFGPGDTGIRLNNFLAPAPVPCELKINVVGTTLGDLVNTTEAPTTTGGGTGLPATATLKVVSPVTVSKAFSPDTITSGGTSLLTITLGNPNDVTLAGAALTDTLPAGVTTVPATAATTCGGAATQAPGSVSLSGGTIPQAGSCTLTVSVTSTALGAHTNTIPAGGVTTANGGSNTAPANAVLTVLAPPPTLGDYPNTTLELSGNAAVTPTAAPTSTARMLVEASTYFKGELEADPVTGVVRVTNAHPAGTHTVTVTAFNVDGVSVSKTFSLAVTTPTPCSPAAFTEADNYPVGTSPYSVAVGDFNGDGVQDVATANFLSDNISVLLGDGSGAFGPSTSFGAGDGPSSVTVADVNRDGFQDLVSTNFSSNNVSVLLGTGAGTFGAASHFAVGTNPYSVAAGDLNADGRLDLAVANQASNNVSILLGSGMGGFGAAVNFAAGAVPTSIALADLNEDDILDLTVANFSSNNVSVLLGTGVGTFGPASNFAVGTTPFSIVVADFNNDGNQDAATANWNSSDVSILLGTGTGTFGTAAHFAAGTIPSSVSVIDLNGDGVLDLAVSVQAPNSIALLEGNGDGTFEAPAAFSAGPAKSVAVGDFNGDGLQDIVSANQTSNDVSVLLRQCAPVITAATITRQQGSPGSVSQIATVSDADQPGEVLAVTVNGGASATVNGVTVSGITVDAAGNVSASVVAACGASDATFTLEVTDAEGATSTGTLTVNVIANSPPALSSYPNAGPLAVGGGTTVTPNAAPTDNGSISTLTAAAPGFTGSLSGNAATGAITVANAGPSGVYTVTVTATDNCGATSTATFQLTVNSNPTIVAAGPLTRTQGAPATVSQIATVNDADQPANTLSVNVNGGASATVNGVTVSGITVNAAGQVSAAVGASCGASNASFTLRVTDSFGAFATATLTVNVLTETTPPVINPIANVTATLPNGSATSMPVTFPLPTATDNCGTVTVTTSPVSGSVFQLGTTTVNVTATDSNGNTATATFTVTVQYPFTGFTGRASSPGANFATAGNTIPLAFSLGGNRGLNIFAPGSPSSQQANCSSWTPIGASSPTSASPGLLFAGGQYYYFWTTNPAWAGTCRVFSMTLNDGTTRTLRFSFYN